MMGRGRTGRGGGGGRGGNNNNNGRGGKGGRTTPRTRTTRTGLNKELEGNIFDLGERSSADLMRTTQIKIAQYIGSLYGGISWRNLRQRRSLWPQHPNTQRLRILNNR